MNYIAFDSHKRYTLASVERAEGGILREVRVGHERGAIRKFLLSCDPGSPVAVETIGSTLPSTIPTLTAATASLTISPCTLPPFFQAARSLRQGHKGARNRSGSGPAISLDHIAIDPHRLLAEQPQIGDGPKAPTNQPLYFLGPAADSSARRLPGNAHLRRGGQHPILSGDPPLAAVAQKARDPVFQLRGANHPGIPHLNQGGAIRVLNVARGNDDGPKFSFFSSVRPHRYK